MKDRTDKRCYPGKGEKAEGWRGSCQVAREESWWEGKGLLDRGSDMTWSGARAGASAAILWQEAVAAAQAWRTLEAMRLCLDLSWHPYGEWSDLGLGAQ